MTLVVNLEKSKRHWATVNIPVDRKDLNVAQVSALVTKVNPRYSPDDRWAIKSFEVVSDERGSGR